MGQWQKFIESAAVDAHPGPAPGPRPRSAGARLRTMVESRRRNNETSDDGPRPYRDLRLLPSVAAAGAAAAAATWMEADTALLFAGVATAAATVLLVLHFMFRPLKYVLLLVVPLAVAAAVMFSAAAQTLGHEAGEISSDVAAGADVVLQAQILSEATGMDSPWGGTRYRVETEATTVVSRGRTYGSHARILVIGGGDWNRVSTGDSVRVPGKLAAAPPGSGFTATLYPSAPPKVQTAVSGWMAVTAEMRDTFRRSAATASPDVQGLLPGMVLGDRSGLTEELEASMKGTGLTHLTAVSGSNCAYVLAFTFLFARTCRLPRVTAVVFGIAALVGFVLLVRPDPSVLRAAVMGSLGVLAVLSGRGRLSLSLLQLAAITLLIANPWIHAEYGFILSILATTGLILLGPPLVNVLASVIPRPAAVVVSIPVAAQILCTPVILTLQPSLPTYSVPANILASPVVPFITILGMAGVLAGAVHPALAVAPTLLAGLGAQWIAGVAHFFYGLPAAATPWLEGPVGIVLACLASLTAIAVVVFLDRRIRPTGNTGNMGRDTHPRVRKPRLAVCGAVVAGTAVVLAAAVVPLPGQRADEWNIAACDVGQGDGFAVRTGPGSAIVIDTGPEPALMDSCLDYLGVEVVELLVLTHAHADHYGGLQGVMKGRTVKEIAYSGADAGLPPQVRALAGDTPLMPVTAGDTGHLGEVSWRALWPAAAVRTDNENNASCVLLVTVMDDGREVKALFTGDLEDDAAGRLLANTPGITDGSIDVLKVGHHGARNGGSRIIERTRPRIAMISVGARNDYGHPGPVIITTLKAVGATVLRTDTTGSFVLDIVGGQLLARTL